jgi:Uma2 family endonuclease
MVTTEPITTAEQLLHAPGLGPCELVRGELIMMTPAGAEHGSIVIAITVPLASFVRQKKLGTLFGAETGFQIGRNPDTVRAPDVAFVRAERVPAKLPRGFFPGPPDLAVEVLSPDDRAGEVLAEVQDWLEAGCRAVWVVDPKTRTVSVYHSPNEAAILAASETLSGGEVLPGFSVPVAEIFAA